MHYQVFVESKSDKLFVASVVGMPNLIVEGKTEEEAIANAKAALQKQLATGRFVEIEVNPSLTHSRGVSYSEKPFYETATDEEWEAALADFVNSSAFTKAPLLSDKDISRESMYQEREDSQL
jgi:predicted RNase H-like HicB family nuclease